MRVNKFQVVVEQFPRECTTGRVPASRVYVQFSMTDTEVLLTDKNNREFSPESIQVKKQTKVDVKLSREDLDNGEDGIEDSISESRTLCALLVLARQIENRTLQNSSVQGYFHRCGVDVKVIGSYVTEAVLPPNKDCGGSSASSPRTIHSLVVTDFKQTMRSAALTLEGVAVCWRDFIHPGCLYILSETCSRYENSVLLKALRTRDRKPIVRVLNDINLVRAPSYGIPVNAPNLALCGKGSEMGRSHGRPVNTPNFASCGKESDKGPDLPLSSKESRDKAVPGPVVEAINGARENFFQRNPLESIEVVLSDRTEELFEKSSKRYIQKYSENPM